MSGLAPLKYWLPPHLVAQVRELSTSQQTGLLCKEMPAPCVRNDRALYDVSGLKAGRLRTPPLQQRCFGTWLKLASLHNALGTHTGWRGAGRQAAHPARDPRIADVFREAPPVSGDDRRHEPPLKEPAHDRRFISCAATSSRPITSGLEFDVRNLAVLGRGGRAALWGAPESRPRKPRRQP